MSTSVSTIRRKMAQEMNLWGGGTNGVPESSGTFTSVDTAGSLFHLYDNARPEPDTYWNGDYMCINPGGTGNPNLPTIWRRLADDSGYVITSSNITQANGGVFNLTAALPSAAYAAVGMTYELYKTFTPEQWMLGINYALRECFPHRHRAVLFEVPEDPSTAYYDWGHLASSLSMANPSLAPTITAVTPTGNPVTGFAASVNYSFAYSYYNAAGETLVSPTTVQVFTAGQVPQFEPLTLPEQALGVNYYCTAEGGSGTQLVRFTIGAAVVGASAPAGATPGQVDPATFQVPQIYFLKPPGRLNAIPTAFNTTSLDIVKLNGIKRRVNPNQNPARYVDLSPNWWRPAGGTIAEVMHRPLNANYNLRFECISPCRPVTAELDTTDEPLELIIAGGMVYLWNILMMSGSAQNVTVWGAELKKAEARYAQAKARYNMEQPRKTWRRPFVKIVRGISEV